MKKISGFAMAAALMMSFCLTASAVWDGSYYEDLKDYGIPSPAGEADIQEALGLSGLADETAFINLSLSADQLYTVATAKPNTKVVLDIRSDNSILSRTWLDPALSTADGFIPGGALDTEPALAVKNTFTTFFANDPIYVYELNHKGGLPGTVHSAIWLGGDTGSALYAYAYRASDNTYKAVHCYVDASSYAHVEYDEGEFIVFATSPLQFK